MPCANSSNECVHKARHLLIIAIFSGKLRAAICERLEKKKKKNGTLKTCSGEQNTFICVESRVSRAKKTNHRLPSNVALLESLVPRWVFVLFINRLSSFSGVKQAGFDAVCTRIWMRGCGGVCCRGRRASTGLLRDTLTAPFPLLSVLFSFATLPLSFLHTSYIHQPRRNRFPNPCRDRSAELKWFLFNYFSH